MVNINGGLDSFPVHVKIEIIVAVKLNFVKATNNFHKLEIFG